MQTIEEAAEELNLSYSATRRRMKALGEVIGKHTKRNSNSKITIDSEGTELIRRLEELRDQGLTIEDAANKIKSDLHYNSKNSSDKNRQSNAKSTLKEKERYINKLEEENRYLKEQIEKKDNQIQQLLPAAQEEEKGNGKDEFKELGLIQVIKKWFTTKT